MNCFISKFLRLCISTMNTETAKAEIIAGSSVQNLEILF